MVNARRFETHRTFQRQKKFVQKSIYAPPPQWMKCFDTRNIKGFPFENFWYRGTKNMIFCEPPPPPSPNMVYPNFRARQMGTADFKLFSAYLEITNF